MRNDKTLCSILAVKKTNQYAANHLKYFVKHVCVSPRAKETRIQENTPFFFSNPNMKQGNGA